MLTPEYLQGLPDELAALTENLETQLIEDIARRVAKAGEITDTAAYQIMRLKEMGASTEYIKKLLADYTKQTEDAIERMIFDAAQTDSEFYQTVYARTGRSYVPYEYNDYLQQLAVAAINQTKGELRNLTQSMGFAVRGSDGRVTFKPAAKAYQSTMDKAQMLVSTGGMDYITAVRMAVNDLAASGLRFVDYDSGIRNHADVAARRAVLTGVSQMTGKIAEHNAAELGTDVVEVDAHAGARPDHAAWQGKWFSLTGKDKRYPLLSQATGYGTVTGLKGANCRHDFYPVIPGIDEPAYTEEELRNIDPPPVKIGDKTYTYYEAEQRQREMERAIRKTKRQIIAAQASGDTEQFTAKSVLLRRQREQYADFSKKAGLVARNERTQVAEFGRSAGSKSSWAARKAKAKTGGSGSSGGHAVTVNVPTPSDNGGKGKLYRDEGLDKSGGSGIINNKDYQTYGLMFVSHRDSLYSYAKNLKPLDDFEDVTFHADRDSFLILDPETQEIIERVSPQKLSELISNSSNYTKGKKIRLLSCQSAYGDNSIAQQLADILGVEIIAPTEVLAISNDGETFISDNLLLIDMWCNGENVEQTGFWKHIKPNEKK